MWNVKPDSVYPEYYNLYNLQSPGNYLYSGYNDDGKVYESDDIPNDKRDHYCWEMLVLQKDDASGKTVALRDKARGKALVAGSNTDNG